VIPVGEAARSESGLPIQALYGSAALDGFDPDAALGVPGGFPFTLGVYPTMYTGRPWTMRQYAGFGTAKESSARYHELIGAGTGGLSLAFDLPTQMGYDSDEPIARGEVGKVGVAIDSVEDMRFLFSGLPLDGISRSMTINAPATTLLLMYQLVAAEQGIAVGKLSGTVHCQQEIPRWNTISISGCHMAEAGATPSQEIAFTVANAKEYVRAALAAGLDIDGFAPRLSFFFVARTTLLEEVAKFRAARRIWTRIMRDEFGAKNPKSQMLRFHTETAGVQVTAQQPEVNLVRVALQALAAVLGGTQSLHTNSYDDAIALPTEKAARLALRTQRVIACETDATKTVDPFAGSYAMESVTDDLEAATLALIQAVEDRGVRSPRSSRASRRLRSKLPHTVSPRTSILAHAPSSASTGSSSTEMSPTSRFVSTRGSRPTSVRARRARGARQPRLTRALSDLRRTAPGTGCVLPPMREALALQATGGEIAHALRDVWASTSRTRPCNGQAREAGAFDEHRRLRQAGAGHGG